MTKNRNSAGWQTTTIPLAANARPAGAVIRVAAGDRLGAEHLLGQHGANQHMRPGQAAEREDVIGPRDHRGVEPFGATDDEAERLSTVPPSGE